MSSSALPKEPVRRKRITLQQLILTLVLLVGSFIMIVPFLWMLVTSFDWRTIKYFIPTENMAGGAIDSNI